MTDGGIGWWLAAATLCGADRWAPDEPAWWPAASALGRPREAERLRAGDAR